MLCAEGVMKAGKSIPALATTFNFLANKPPCPLVSLLSLCWKNNATWGAPKWSRSGVEARWLSGVEATIVFSKLISEPRVPSRTSGTLEGPSKPGGWARCTERDALSEAEVKSKWSRSPVAERSRSHVTKRPSMSSSMVRLTRERSSELHSAVLSIFSVTHTQTYRQLILIWIIFPKLFPLVCCI